MKRIDCPRCDGTGCGCKRDHLHSVVSCVCAACYGYIGDIAPRVRVWAIVIPLCTLLAVGCIVAAVFITPVAIALSALGVFVLGLTWSEEGSPREAMQLLKEARERERTVDQAR